MKSIWPKHNILNSGLIDHVAFLLPIVFPCDSSNRMSEVRQLVLDSEDRYDLELSRYATGFVDGLKRHMEEGGSDKCYGFVLGTRKGDPNCGVQTSFTPSR